MYSAQQTTNEEPSVPRSPATSVDTTNTSNDGLTSRPAQFVPPLVQSINARPRRAARACLACRSRKVRCDVTQNYPCGNCRWNEHDCVIHSRRAKVSVLSERPLPLTYTHVLTPFPRQLQTAAKRARTQVDAVPSSSPKLTEQPSASCELPQGPGEHIPPEEEQGLEQLKQGLPEASLADTDEPPRFQDGFKQPALIIPGALHFDGAFSGTGYLQRPHVLVGSRSWSLRLIPRFVKPLPADMPLEDVEFLQAKGALAIPETRPREALIQAYLEHVHPLLPMINIEDFIESMIEENEFNLKISLLFLQAVMFAGSAYVDWSLLAEAGFKSRKEARETFYQRVRLLYQFDCEKDGLVNIQSLLLMTMWHDETDERTNIRRWMDLAISHAFAQSLNIDPRFNRSAMSLTVRRLRRRIWWSCFIRDRLISFAMRTLPRIRDEDYNVAMLEFADFQSEYMHANASAKISAICSYFGNKNRRTTLARLCIAQARLCRSLSCTALSVFSNPIKTASNSFPKGESSEHLIAACHRDLLEWYDTLCHGDLYQPILAHDIHTDGSANLELNRSVLHMIYHAGILALHRSRISDSGTSPGDKELSKTFVQHSAKRISEIMSNIQEHGLDRFLPLAAITTTTSAISVHFLEIRGVFRANLFDSQENYQRCLKVIKSMKEIYSTAECSTSLSDNSNFNPQQEDFGGSIYSHGTDDWNEARGWRELQRTDSTDTNSNVPAWRCEGTRTQWSSPRMPPVDGFLRDLDDNFVFPG